MHLQTIPLLNYLEAFTTEIRILDDEWVPAAFVVLPAPKMVLQLIAAAPQARMFFSAAQMILNVHTATIYRLSKTAA